MWDELGLVEIYEKSELVAQLQQEPYVFGCAALLLRLPEPIVQVHEQVHPLGVQQVLDLGDDAGERVGGRLQSKRKGRVLINPPVVQEAQVLPVAGVHGYMEKGIVQVDAEGPVPGL